MLQPEVLFNLQHHTAGPGCDYILSPLGRLHCSAFLTSCSSQVGEKFRARSLKFPGLISGCTMDWFSRWPKEALIAVASYFLADYNIVCSSETKRQVVETMGLFHDMVSESCENYFQRCVSLQKLGSCEHYFQREARFHKICSCWNWSRKVLSKEALNVTTSKRPFA